MKNKEHIKSGELREHLEQTILSQANMRVRGNPKEQTANPINYPQGRFKDKQCRWCTTRFSPKGPSQFYCGDECRDAANTDKYYKNLYGIGLLEIEHMFKEQGGKCKICKTDGFKMRPDNRTSLVVDHCHETGVVRGLLCHNCNRGLGLLKDNIENLKSAISYLEGATTIRKE